MDNFTILQLIHNHCPKLSHKFVGCFPCNTFPIIHESGQFEIVNTAPKTDPGEHWVLIGRYNNNGNYPSLFYFDSLSTVVDSAANRGEWEDEVAYECIKQRLFHLYPGTVDIDILHPLQFGVEPQGSSTTTCALYCIYMAHLIYLGLWSTYSVTEDDILQFAQEHFGHKFVKHVINL